MSLACSELTRLLVPPECPEELDREWDDVENDLGRKLPHDYKCFVDTYGSGTISEEIDVWNYRSATFAAPRSSLIEKLCGVDSVIQGYEESRRMGRREWSFSMFPTTGGLLPFATLYDVDNLNWATTIESDQWDIVYWSGDNAEFTKLGEEPFSLCFFKLLMNQFQSDVVPQFPHELRFRPLSQS